MEAMVNCYKVLGVDQKASLDEIRKAFKRIASENHPDRVKNNPNGMRRYKEASAAYAVLSNDRAAHDRALQNEESRFWDAASEVSEILRGVAERRSGKLGTVIGGLASTIDVTAGKRSPTAEELKQIFDGFGTAAEWLDEFMNDGRGDGT